MIFFSEDNGGVGLGVAFGAEVLREEKTRI